MFSFNSEGAVKTAAANTVAAKAAVAGGATKCKNRRGTASHLSASRVNVVRALVPAFSGISR